MSFIEELARLEMLYKMVEQRTAGPVNCLAEKFQVSNSTVKRMVRDLEYYKKVPIKYCRRVNSYIIHEYEIQ